MAETWDDWLPPLQWSTQSASPSATFDHAPIGGYTNRAKMYEIQRKMAAVVSCTLDPYKVR